MKFGASGFKRFFKTSVIFFIGTVLSKVVSFFMIPLYTKYISTESMGEFDLILTYVNAVIPVLFVEIWSALIRFLHDSSEESYKNRVFSALGKVMFVSTLVGTAIVLILNFIFDINNILQIYLLGLLLAISYIYQFGARGVEDNIGFAISGVINTFVLSLSNYIFIVKFSWGLDALLLSMILGNLAQIVFLEFRIKLLRKLFKRDKSDSMLKTMIKYSLPLSVNSISFWALKSSNKVVMNEILGLEANGIYAVSQKFANLVAFITTAFNYAWQDIAFSKKDKDDGEFYSQAVGYYTLALGVGGALLIIASKWIAPLIIHENYSMSIALIPLGIMGAIANSISTFVGNIFGAIKNTTNILTSTLICSVLNIILSIILIPIIGMQGANIALFASFVLNIIIRMARLNKLIGVKFNIKYTLISIAVSSLAIFIFYL